MIKDIFTAATMKEAPAGIGKFNGSRAMYGLDVMLRWDRESNSKFLTTFTRIFHLICIIFCMSCEIHELAILVFAIYYYYVLYVCGSFHRS